MPYRCAWQCANQQVHQMTHQGKCLLKFLAQGGWERWIYREEPGQGWPNGAFRCLCGAFASANPMAVKYHANSCLKADNGRPEPRRSARLIEQAIARAQAQAQAEGPLQNNLRTEARRFILGALQHNVQEQEAANDEMDALLDILEVNRKGTLQAVDEVEGLRDPSTFAMEYTLWPLKITPNPPVLFNERPNRAAQLRDVWDQLQQACGNMVCKDTQAQQLPFDATGNLNIRFEVQRVPNDPLPTMIVDMTPINTSLDNIAILMDSANVAPLGPYSSIVNVRASLEDPPFPGVAQQQAAEEPEEEEEEDEEEDEEDEDEEAPDFWIAMGEEPIVPPEGFGIFDPVLDEPEEEEPEEEEVEEAPDFWIAMGEEPIVPPEGFGIFDPVLDEPEEEEPEEEEPED